MEQRNIQMMNYLKSSKIIKDLSSYIKPANMTDGFNSVDITDFCERLKLKAIHRSIRSNSDEPMTMEDIYEVRDEVCSSVDKEGLEKLELFKNS